MKLTLNKKTIILSSLVLFFIFISLLFVHNNFNLYKQPIVEITQAIPKDKKESIGLANNEGTISHQRLVGKIKNGPYKDAIILLENTYSSSGAYDHKYQVGDQLFITIQNDKGIELTGNIDYPKRDTFVVVTAWLFMIIVFLIGKKSGLFSIISLIINIFILLFALNRYTELEGASLLLICSGLVVFFTVTSLLLVSGNNEKTYAAILATIIGTFSALLIAYVVMKITAERGLRYEEMAFVTRSPQKIFLASILIGSLGAVMDIAITITSSLYELYDKNNFISLKDLKESGTQIGKDIMGSMTNVLFFAYISGSIPMLLLYLKNGAPLSYALSMNLSLELTRALVGGIGIVLTIPISIYTTTYFIHKRRLSK
ncbi:MAG: YibE/F family protein [Carnobacterium sp.]|nr:YibE/F family protein [Carnobacterium sp.]